MLEQLIQNPADNLRRWHGDNCKCPKCHAARRERRMDAVENGRLARIGANARAERVAVGRMAAAIGAVKLSDVGAKPDLAEAERAEFDRMNVGERFDGLS